MSNLQEYDAYLQAGRQVSRLEQQQARRAGYVGNADDHRFRLAATCPPSTNIRFQGGLLWWPAYSLWPAGFFVPSYTVDLSDIDKVYGIFRFTNAYWYMPVLVGLNQDVWPPPEPWPAEPVDDTLYFMRGDECETAAEAEAGIREIIGDTLAYYAHGMGGIVLRNNGNTLENNQFMVVDPINRGRSYLFGKKRYGWELA